MTPASKFLTAVFIVIGGLALAGRFGDVGFWIRVILTPFMVVGLVAWLISLVKNAHGGWRGFREGWKDDR